MNQANFEFPLNEKVRNYLRVEHMFNSIVDLESCCAKNNEVTFLRNLFQLLDLIERVDLKSELIRDLNIYTQHLNHWLTFPNVNKDKLNTALDEVTQTIDALNTSPRIGCSLKKDRFLSSIRAIVDKRREKAGEIAEMTVIGNVSGKKCIIVDDICDTAGTLCKAAELLIENGASEVHSYITHGVLSGPAVERITKSVMKSLVITDSIEASPAVLAAPNIRIVPTAPMFAQAILNIWNGTSVSSLFETDTLEPIYDGLY